MGNPLDVLGGLDDAAAYKVPCACATLVDMTANMIGLPVIDGYQVQAGDRVLVMANTDQTTNGIYDASLGAWCRSIDFTNSSAIYQGTQVYVVNGVKNGGVDFVCQTNRPVIGSTAITFKYGNVGMG